MVGGLFQWDISNQNQAGTRKKVGKKNMGYLKRRAG